MESEEVMQRPDPLVGEFRVKVPLPVAIPFGALLFIGAGVFFFSRVLLAVPREAAIAIAIALAANILGGAAFMALHPRMSRASRIELLAVVMYPVIIGLAIWALEIGVEEHVVPATAEEAHEETGGSTGSESSTGTTSELSASGNSFSADALTFAAGEETAFTFTNEDAVPHNLSIYQDDSLQETLFEGELVDGGSSADYTIPALDPGEYFFRCDVHPPMNGTVTVE